MPRNYDALKVYYAGYVCMYVCTHLCLYEELCPHYLCIADYAPRVSCLLGEAAELHSFSDKSSFCALGIICTQLFEANTIELIKYFRQWQ